MLERSRMPVMGHSRKTEEIDKKPGPGDYDTIRSDKAFKKTISHHIGHAERIKTSLDKYPGRTFNEIKQASMPTWMNSLEDSNRRKGLRWELKKDQKQSIRGPTASSNSTVLVI